jgi:hypothetical protein
MAVFAILELWTTETGAARGWVVLPIPLFSFDG